MENNPREPNKRFGVCSKEVADFADKAAEGLKPGDTVYKIRVNNTLEKCLFCGGTGRIEAKIAEETHLIYCPKCDGSCYQKKMRMSVEKDKIEYVSLNLSPEKNGGWTWNISKLHSKRNTCCENLNQIFLTEKEATDYAKTENKILKQEEN